MRARATAFCEAIGKTPVEVPDEPGFVVNRLLFPYLFDAVRLLERTGMEPEQVDACMKLGASHPMGPLELLDLVGIDVADAIGEALHADTGDPAHRPPGRIKELVGERAPGPEVRAPASTTTLAALAGGLAGALRARGLACLRGFFTRGEAGSFLRPAMSQITSASLIPCSSACSLTCGQGSSRLGQVVPARELQRLERALELGPDLALDADQVLERLELALGEACGPHTADHPQVDVGSRPQARGAADGSAAAAVSARLAASVLAPCVGWMRTASTRFSRTDSTRIR